jgi:LAGLIDADG endonuclease
VGSGLQRLSAREPAGSCVRTVLIGEFIDDVFYTRPTVQRWDGAGGVNAEVGFRLAGLTDGEGCFSIATNHCAFVVKMRADDRPLLERIRSEVGSPGRFANAKGLGETQKPQVSWIISRKAELLWLTEVFDAFPLWSKKARDYEIWREAVIAWYSGLTDFTAYREAIREAREYRESDAIPKAQREHA